MIPSYILMSLSLVIYAIILREIAEISRTTRVPRPVRQVYMVWVATPLVLLGASSILAFLDLTVGLESAIFNSLATYAFGCSFFPFFTGTWVFVELLR